MVTMAQLGVNVRKLNSNLRAFLVTPSSTRGKNRNDFDKNRKGMVGESQTLPSSPLFSTPMSSHAIAQLRDPESEDEEDESETANQRMLRLGVDDESDSDPDDGGEVDPDDDGDVDLEQEYQFTEDVVRECTSNLLLPEKDLTLFIRDNFSCNLCSHGV
jgi:hypothetical protein